MTEQERFQRAFAPLHAPSDTLTEVMKMTEQTHRKSGRRTAVIALAAALLLATGSAAYAADLGSIQRRVQLWLHGDQTDAVMTVERGTIRWSTQMKTARHSSAAEAVWPLSRTAPNGRSPRRS